MQLSKPPSPFPLSKSTYALTCAPSGSAAYRDNAMVRGLFCSSSDATALNKARARLQVLERFPDDGIANAEEARVRLLS